MDAMINGRTPEEIKRVLEWAKFACGDLVCEECPYYENVCSHESYEKIAPDALSLIEHLEAKVPKWISVEERLPDNDAKYLVYMPDYGLYEVAEYYGDGEWQAVDFTDLTRHVSHWMPLPEPPEVSA